MSSNINTMNMGMEAASAAGIRGDQAVGGGAQSDNGVQQARNESLPSGPGDNLPNAAIGAMRSAQVEGISDQGAHRMLNNGFSIGEGHGGMGAKLGEAVAIAGPGARAAAGGEGARAIAEGPGASAVAEGRDSRAIAEGPGAHAVAEGPGAHAIAADPSRLGHAELPLKSDQGIQVSRAFPADAKERELPLKGAINQGVAQKLLFGHASKDY